MQKNPHQVGSDSKVVDATHIHQEGVESFVIYGIEAPGRRRWSEMVWDSVCVHVCRRARTCAHTHTPTHTDTHTHTHTLPSVLVMVREEAQKDESCADMGGVVWISSQHQRLRALRFSYPLCVGARGSGGIRLKSSGCQASTHGWDSPWQGVKAALRWPAEAQCGGSTQWGVT